MSLPPPNRRVPLVLAALASVLAVLGYLRYRAKRTAVAPAASASAAARPSASNDWTPGSGQGRRGSGRGGLPTKEKIQRRLEMYSEETRYPPASVPLSKRPAFRYPETPPPVEKSSGDDKHKVAQHERQNMYYVAEGETPIVFADFTINGEAVTDAAHVNGTLSKLEGNPRVIGGGISNVTFHDDGVTPDEKARDGTVTASVPFPKDAIGTFLGDMSLSATVKSGETLLFMTYGFVYTGHPPAHFTGRVRETIEDGSLALYVGVEFEKEEGYIMRARLYDADGNPLLFMSADGQYGPDTHEIRFFAFGRALRDLEAKSPFSLRDVEGYVEVPDSKPDRKKVPTWPGPYSTRRYGPKDFSEKEWMTPEKQERVDQMRKAIELAPE